MSRASIRTSPIWPTAMPRNSIDGSNSVTVKRNSVLAARKVSDRPTTRRRNVSSIERKLGAAAELKGGTHPYYIPGRGMLSAACGLHRALLTREGGEFVECFRNPIGDLPDVRHMLTTGLHADRHVVAVAPAG